MEGTPPTTVQELLLAMDTASFPNVMTAFRIVIIIIIIIIIYLLDKDSDSTEISSLDVQGKVLTRKRDIAHALNHHFVTVGPKL